MKAKTSCNKCHGICCIECYIDSFRKNKGIVVCGLCDYSYGVKTPDKYIDVLVGDIRDNLLQMNK
jgi:transcription elongation factor Elf1